MTDFQAQEQDRAEPHSGDTIFLGSPHGYWAESRRPLASLLFILPFLVVYEVGILILGPAATRNGVDVWLRHLLEWMGFGQYFLLPLLTIVILLSWQYTSREPWRISRWRVVRNAGGKPRAGSLPASDTPHAGHVVEPFPDFQQPDHVPRRRHIRRVAFSANLPHGRGMDTALDRLATNTEHSFGRDNNQPVVFGRTLYRTARRTNANIQLYLSLRGRRLFLRVVRLSWIWHRRRNTRRL